MSGYVLEGPKWSSTTITWSFATSTYAQDSTDAFSSYITQTLYQSVIEAALAKWQSVSGITFVQVADSSSSTTAADIRFGFADLPISTVGEIGETTYYYSGTTFLPDVVIQLEDPADKPLSNTAAGLTYSGTVSTLYQVVLHEIGHAVGMGHDTDSASIMYPIATATNRNLDSTDISGVQALYGAPVAAADTTSTSTSDSSNTTATTSSVSGSTLTLQGTHGQYTIAVAANGQITIDDTVSGRDGDRTLSGITTLKFSDGTGLVDATGVEEDVARLYYTAFGAVGGAAGMAYWTGVIEAGGSELSVAQSFLGTAQFAPYRAMSNTAFVNAVYENALGRAADTAGLNYWSNALQNGTSRAQLLLLLANSTELTQDLIATQGDSNEAEAYRLYDAALNRAPDTAGLNYWTGQLDAGVSAAQIAQSFLSSAEYQKTYGGLANGAFVNALYENVLDRAADTTGAAFWNATLQSGISRSQVLLDFSDSAENRLKTASSTHANWIFIAS